jgi:hypothetical protein
MTDGIGIGKAKKIVNQKAIGRVDRNLKDLTIAAFDPYYFH